ncbi:unnamed protein product [Symbiodinium pilosum]|uniref:Uncharacterized protein n=1 Tax=Symbiodinium pilosum TaxID=2952 RepID=A0A812P5Y4_SYMPI|nr:unnamed protein product [Symbiodinium pilosum]
MKAVEEVENDSRQVEMEEEIRTLEEHRRKLLQELEETSTKLAQVRDSRLGLLQQHGEVTAKHRQKTMQLESELQDLRPASFYKVLSSRAANMTEGELVSALKRTTDRWSQLSSRFATVGWTSARECGFPTQVIGHTKLGAMPQREATSDNCVCERRIDLDFADPHTLVSTVTAAGDVMLAFVPEPRCILSAPPKNAPDLRGPLEPGSFVRPPGLRPFATANVDGATCAGNFPNVGPELMKL